MAFCSARLHKNRALQGYGISLRYFCRQKHTLRVPSDPLPQAGRAQKRTVKSPSLRSKLAAWRRHAGSLPQAGTCVKAHSKISRVCGANSQRGADTQDPCHRQGVRFCAQQRAVKIKFKKNQKFSKKEKRALDTKRAWVIYSFSRRNEAAASRKGRQKASKK